MTTKTTLCRECGKDRVLSPDGICIPCYAESKTTNEWNTAIQAALDAIASESLAHSSEEGEFYITDKIIAALEKLKRPT